MQPLAGIIALQECVLAALILVSIPGAPTQQQWPADAACLAGTPPEVAAAQGCTLSDVIVLVLISCLGGFLLGRHSAQAGLWPLLQQQQSQELQQHSSSWVWASDSPSTATVQLVQYAALAWQQLRHVLLAIAAAGAKCTAALLALLAAKASITAAAAFDAAAAAAAHERGQNGVQYLDASSYDGTDGADIDTDDGSSSAHDRDFEAPSFITFLTHNKQQPAPQQQQEQQQQSVSLWQAGLHSQLPAPPAAAAAAADSLTFPAHCNSSRSSSSHACRNAAHSAACASRTHGNNGSIGGCSSSSSSGSRRHPVVRSDSGPLQMSGPASVNTLTPLGCGWMCVMSRSSPAVEAAAAQAGSEQQQQQRQQQQELGRSMSQQLAGEDISLGVVLGCGAYGKVYRGQWRGHAVAVKVLYHSGLRAAARAVHETDLMLQACHKNVVQTHHVLMWQRAKAVIDDCTHEFGGAAGAAAQREQHMLSPFDQPSSLADGNRTTMHADSNAEAVAAADGEGAVQGGRRYSNLHVGNSNGTGVSACGVMDLSAAESDAVDGWMGQAGMVDDDEDELEAQTWIVQELCDGGPLDAAARNGRIATTERMLSCLLDVARGLEYLHSKGLMHGDLKAGNVCLVSTKPAAAAVDGGVARPGAPSPACNGNAEGGRSSNSSNAAGFNFVCKVMDFSLSKALDAGKTHCSTQSLGTITHMAPELLLTGKQSKAADVYSMGMLVWEVLHGGQTPFRHCSHSMEVMQLVLQKQRPRWQPGCPPELIALAEQCWAADPATRPCISAVCEQLLQLQLTLQLQHIDMAGWPSGAWLMPTAAAAVAGGEGSGEASAPAVAPHAGSVQQQQQGSSRRGSGSSSGSTGAASFCNVAATAVAAAEAAEAAADSSSSRPGLRQPVSAGAVLQTCGFVRTLDQVLCDGLNPTGRSSSSQLGAELGRTNGSSSRAILARYHSVAHVDRVGSASQQERPNGLQACRSSNGRGGSSYVAGTSTGAGVSEMQAFVNVLVTGRKAVARGVDCSALDALGSREEAKQSGSVWPVQQQQQWRLSASGVVAAPPADSAGNELGPMVGYWD